VPLKSEVQVTEPKPVASTKFPSLLPMVIKSEETVLEKIYSVPCVTFTFENSPAQPMGVTSCTIPIQMGSNTSRGYCPYPASKHPASNSVELILEEKLLFEVNSWPNKRKLKKNKAKDKNLSFIREIFIVLKITI